MSCWLWYAIDSLNHAFQEAELLNQKILAVNTEKDQMAGQLKGLQDSISQLYTQMETQTQQASAQVRIRPLLEVSWNVFFIL